MQTRVSQKEPSGPLGGHEVIIWNYTRYSGVDDEEQKIIKKSVRVAKW